MEPQLVVSRDIAAAPNVVFTALTDMTRMGEWSPECYEAEWKDGATGPAVGATFTGHNRNGDKEWSIDAARTQRADFRCERPSYPQSGGHGSNSRTPRRSA